jgi:hypothetical protein
MTYHVLYKKRLFSLDESKISELDAYSLMKIINGEEMCARRRYENSFVFRPTVNKSLS